MLGQVSYTMAEVLSSQTLFESTMELRKTFISKLPFRDAQTL